VYRDNPDVSDVDDSTHGLDYFRVAMYIPFLDTILEQLRFRFNEKTTFAGLFDTLLPLTVQRMVQWKKSSCSFMETILNFFMLTMLCLMILVA
jgi:hypothetical protein